MRGVWIDVGCPDFQQAKANRTRIASGYATTWWKAMERARNNTPARYIGKVLVDGLPIPTAELYYLDTRTIPRRTTYDDDE